MQKNKKETIIVASIGNSVKNIVLYVEINLKFAIKLEGRISFIRLFICMKFYFSERASFRFFNCFLLVKTETCFLTNLTPMIIWSIHNNAGSIDLQFQRKKNYKCSQGASKERPKTICFRDVIKALFLKLKKSFLGETRNDYFIFCSKNIRISCSTIRRCTCGFDFVHFTYDKYGKCSCRFLNKKTRAQMILAMKNFVGLQFQNFYIAKIPIK